jgi:uncharacterized membrane protein
MVRIVGAFGGADQGREGRGARVGKERLLAFTDGVIAVIITIMVLELRPPQGVDLAALRGLAPTFLAYVLSFVYVAIYWNNHHHFFQLVRSVNGAILWANANLVFWLSLVPFTTAWMGAHPFDPIPTAVYGASLLMPALAWSLLHWTIGRQPGAGEDLTAALGANWKGRISPVLYLCGVGAAFLSPRLADAFYAGVALMWLRPDRRIERRVGMG